MKQMQALKEAAKPQDFWLLHPAKVLNKELNKLPVARLTNIKSCDEEGIENDGVDAKGFRAVIVDNSIVSCPTKSYTLVQHKKAFRPIIEGITRVGIKDFRYSLYFDSHKAHLNLYIDTAKEKGVDNGIFVGFRVTNSFDRSTSIRYGFESFQKNSYFEIVGYRVACSNGMIVKVPLNKAEFVRNEERVKLKELLSLSRRILHTGNVDVKIDEVQYIVEAMSVLIKPFERMVEAAKEIKYTDLKIARKLIEKHVGRRMKERIISRYVDGEDFSLWGLYNAVTYEASHTNLASTTSMGLLERSGTMLTQVLLAQ